MKQEKRVKVKIPKAGPGEEQEIFVGVNGAFYRIRRGVEVEVPAAVANVLRYAELAEEKQDAFLESAASLEAK